MIYLTCFEIKRKFLMILITGSAGYIGSHCTLALLERGYEVVGFDNFSVGHIETVEKLKLYGKDKFKFIQGDLLIENDIQKIFSNYKIDAVIHFAAFSLVGESCLNPSKYYRNNVVGTLNLLDKMVENNVLKIVFSSTAATYGEAQYVPIDELHPKKPCNPYGKSKLMIEEIMDDFDKAYNLKSVRLRYFSVAGADEKTRVGEWHTTETHLIPNVLKSALNENKTFNLFGYDYDTKDGTCVRDYINVEDLIEAHILALEYLNKFETTNFFNLGTNEGNSVKEVFDLCEKITGKKINLNIEKRREGDPATLIAKNKKAKEILGWEPRKTLYDSIKSAWEYEKSRK